METRSGSSRTSQEKFNMAERGRLLIDLNACADPTDDSDNLETGHAIEITHDIASPTLAADVAESVFAAQVDRPAMESFETSRQAKEGSTGTDGVEIVKQQEIGGQPQTIDVVIAYRLRTNNVGDAVEFLGVAGAPRDGKPPSCTCCGKPERVGKTLICDACEQSYHLKCVKVRENQAAGLDEWLCTTCTTTQRNQPWALGRLQSRPQAEIRGDATLENKKPTDIETGPSSIGIQHDSMKRPKRDRETETDMNAMLKKQQLPTDSGWPNENKARQSSRQVTTR